MPFRKSSPSPLMTYIQETSPPTKTAKGFSKQQFNKGEDIFTEGDIGYDAFILKSGTVEISIQDNGEKLILTQVKEQSVFGEMALVLGNHKRTATATAVDTCQVIRIPKKVFDKYMKASPAVITKCLIAIATRLDELTGKASLAAPDLFEGIARVLHLMQVHQQNNLLYDEVLDTLSKLLSHPKAQVEETIDMMKAMNLVKISQPKRDHKRLFITGRSQFLDKALKIKAILRQYQESGREKKDDDGVFIGLPPGQKND
ncbi:MAG: cyclic nucleotide-binding domain-containing protein [Desulfobacter sp.]